MDGKLVGECQDIMQSTDMQPLAKLAKLVERLTEAGLCHRVVLKPDALLIHPHNRGSSMCNSHDAHARGFHLEKIGVRKALLCDSFCIEISTEEPMRSNQNPSEQGSGCQFVRNACIGEWERKSNEHQLQSHDGLHEGGHGRLHNCRW